MSKSTSDTEIQIASQEVEVTLEDTFGLLKDLKSDRDEKLEEIWNLESNNLLAIPLDRSNSQPDIIAKQQKLLQSFTDQVRRNEFHYYQVPSSEDLCLSVLDRLEDDIERLSELTKRNQEQLQRTRQRIDGLTEQNMVLEKMKKACLTANQVVVTRTWNRELSITSKIFREVKADLHQLVQILFPDDDHVRNFLSELCAAYFRTGDQVYIDLEPEFTDIANFLLEADLITYDPYDKTKVKLLNLV